jgi:hypothetical protein
MFTNGGDKQNHSTSIALSGIARILIGARINAGSVGAFCNGLLADCVAYSRALSDAEVAQLYRWGPMSLPRNGLVFWTRMTEAGDLRDLVGGRILTPYNSPGVSPLHPRVR